MLLDPAASAQGGALDQPFDAQCGLCSSGGPLPGVCKECSVLSPASSPPPALRIELVL